MDFPIYLPTTQFFVQTFFLKKVWLEDTLPTYGLDICPKFRSFFFMGLSPKPHISFNAAKTVLEGYGCYRLHERKNYRGRSMSVSVRGVHDVTLGRVRSISKISCASPAIRKQETPRGRGSYIFIRFKAKKHCKKRRHNHHQ